MEASIIWLQAPGPRPILSAGAGLCKMTRVWDYMGTTGQKRREVPREGCTVLPSEGLAARLIEDTLPVPSQRALNKLKD